MQVINWTNEQVDGVGWQFREGCIGDRKDLVKAKVDETTSSTQWKIV